MKYSLKNKVVLEVTDLHGATVRFEKKNFDKHKNKHPELRQKIFCPKQIIMALKQPTFTIEGNQKETLCYYLELFRFRSIRKYAKIVVQETNRLSKIDPHCIIKTAFKTDHIQETKYNSVPTYYNKK